jgi:hypothetical protein
MGFLMCIHNGRVRLCSDVRYLPGGGHTSFGFTDTREIRPDAPPMYAGGLIEIGDEICLVYPERADVNFYVPRFASEWSHPKNVM